MKSRKILSENLEIKPLLDENREIIDALRKLNERLSSEISVSSKIFSHEKLEKEAEKLKVKTDLDHFRSSEAKPLSEIIVEIEH
jgi:D-ribose pyranose/furanose isomerase RbsD